MPYPYQGQLAPYTGGGLPGLPVRNRVISTNTVNNLYSTPSRKVLTPVGSPSSIGTGANSGFTAFPCSCTSSLGLLRRRDNNGYNYAVPFTYDESGISLKTASQSTLSANYFLPAFTIPLRDDRFAYMASQTQCYVSTINPLTNSWTESLLFTLGSGTLVTGESYTIHGNGFNPRTSLRDMVLTEAGNLRVFGLINVGSSIYIACWEYSQTGTLLGVYKIASPNIYNPSSGYTMEVFQVGYWYHIIFFDISPSTPTPAYQARLTYITCKDDLSEHVVPLSVTQNTSSSSSASKHCRALCDDRSMLIVTHHKDGTPWTVFSDTSYLIPINPDGSVTPIVSTTYGRLSENALGTSCNASLYQRVFNDYHYNPVYKLWFNNDKQAIRDNGSCRDLGIFSTNISRGQGKTFYNSCMQVFKYETTGISSEGNITSRINDHVSVLECSYDTSGNGFIPEMAYPLENGYWIVMQNTPSSSSCYVRLYKEI